MQYFERQNDSLIFRLNGETVMVSPWGEDSLRTRAALFNELSDNSPYFFLRQKVSLLSNSGNVRL